MEIGETLYVTTRDDFRNGWKRSQNQKRDLANSIQKCHKKPSINFHEAVEEAMCFGWTDPLASKVWTRNAMSRATHRANRNRSGQEQGTCEKINCRRQDDGSRAYDFAARCYGIAWTTSVFIKTSQSVQLYSLPLLDEHGADDKFFEFSKR